MPRLTRTPQSGTLHLAAARLWWGQRGGHAGLCLFLQLPTRVCSIGAKGCGKIPRRPELIEVAGLLRSAVCRYRRSLSRHECRTAHEAAIILARATTRPAQEQTAGARTSP